MAAARAAEPIPPAPATEAAKRNGMELEAATADDWDLFAKACGVLQRALVVEGKRSLAAAAPVNVKALAEHLKRLVAYWPALPFAMKQRLSAARDTGKLAMCLNQAMRDLNLGPWAGDEAE